MAYSPTEWQTGDIITDEKLNKLENGVANTLPTVTSDDNGDVLTVVEGAWAKAAPSGGSGVFEINFTVVYDDQQQTNVITCDKTYAEIVAAQQGGYYIVAQANFFSGLMCKDCYSTINPPTVGFAFVGVSTAYDQMLATTIYYNDNASAWTMQSPKYYTLTESS